MKNSIVKVFKIIYNYKRKGRTELFMSRFVERRNDYKSALNKIEESLENIPNEIEETTLQVLIDGTLHRFEFTFELAWKTIKDYLEYMGITNKVGSPIENIQLAYKQRIIEEGEIWIEIMLARNELSHLYDEQTSRKIYDNIKNRYIKEFKKLEEKFEQIL